jgi:hypothetical protein
MPNTDHTLPKRWQEGKREGKQGKGKGWWRAKEEERGEGKDRELLKCSSKKINKR